MRARAWRGRLCGRQIGFEFLLRVMPSNSAHCGACAHAVGSRTLWATTTISVIPAEYRTTAGVLGAIDSGGSRLGGKRECVACVQIRKVNRIAVEDDSLFDPLPFDDDPFFFKFFNCF
jgi:hypothetical protein